MLGEERRSRRRSIGVAAAESGEKIKPQLEECRGRLPSYRSETERGQCY